MTKPKTRRNDTTGMKYLIASLSIAASLALWSTFSNQDRLAQMANAATQSAPTQTNTLMVEPMPTLVNIQFPDGQVVTVQQAEQQLRSVSAPASTRSTGNPVVIMGSSGGGGGNAPSSAGNVITTTSSSG